MCECVEYSADDIGSLFSVFHATLQRYNFNFCHTTFLEVVCMPFLVYFKIFYSLIQGLHFIFFHKFYCEHKIVCFSFFSLPFSSLYKATTNFRCFHAMQTARKIYRYVHSYICIKMWKCENVCYKEMEVCWNRVESCRINVDKCHKNVKC